MLCLAHVPIALLLSRSGTIAAIHAVATIGVGLVAVLFSRGYVERAAYAGAYITGAEVIWRMTSAGVYWEIGKYGMAMIFFAAILRGRFKAPLLPICYFILLLPACAMTVENESLRKSLDLFSGHLSGPLALMTAAWFFSSVRLSIVQFQRLLLALMSPVVGVAVYTLFYTQAATDLSFANQSNFVTSGGFGPNQVSTTLGLGFLAAFLFILIRRVRLDFRALAFLAMLLMGIQSALTFSRAGLYNAAGAGLLAAFYFLRDRKSRGRFIVLAAVLVLATVSIILPGLNAFTGGALSERFSNTGTTGRDRIALAELDAFDQNPILGVGVGQARTFSSKMPHTEFTRLLAEHGSLGLIAIAILLTMGIQTLRRAPSNESKAVVIAMLGWSILFMLNTGMRLVAPAFTFGLAFATVFPMSIRARKGTHGPTGYRRPRNRIANRSDESLESSDRHRSRCNGEGGVEHGH